MSIRTSACLVGCLAALTAFASVGCGSDKPDEMTEADARALTVSYRNKVRVPEAGKAMSAESYADQLRKRDPIGPVRCMGEEGPAYKDVTRFLGGIEWSHPVSIIKDRSFPQLFDAMYTIDNSMSDRAEGANAADFGSSGAAPVISRPDLVGVQNGTAVFLSKQHGILAVDVKDPANPKLTCSMKLPGEPKNFLFHNNELVIIVNARGNNRDRAALLRYSFEGGSGSLHFVDAVRLDNQNIIDARLFDSTIVAYTSWTKEGKIQPDDIDVNTAPTPTYANTGTGSGGRSSAASESAGSFGAPSNGMSNNNHLGSKVIVVQWDKELNIDWEDALLDDTKEQDIFNGQKPDTNYKPGQIIHEYKTFKQFVAASDRYVVVPRSVERTIFSHYTTYSYPVCSKYNPQDHQITQCTVQYERRDNPDYVAPAPATGDYSCNGKPLAECIKQAAPTVSQYVMVPVGQSCQPVWVGRCEETKMETVTYPQFTQESTTEMMIYRFENNAFTKLDATLGKMVEKPGALAFETGPLVVKGSVENRNQIQFQNGHLYVFSDQALQTMTVAGNSIAYVHRLSATTSGNPAIAFSNDRAMISSTQYTYPHNTSSVSMIDLTSPSIPVSLNQFDMPGQTTQLILAAGGILGPGQVAFDYARVNRSLQKVTLFSNEGGQELDNLLLGTEYDVFESSWFDTQDDQRIRLNNDGSRLFLPYSGRHHADQYEPIAHRLNISRIENKRLVSERSFQLSDDIIRTAPIDDQRSLAFANSAAYMVDHTTGDWVLSTLREIFVPFATYRFSDDFDLHARISRVGSKCKVTTIGGDGQIFGTEKLAELDIPCGETSEPSGFGPNLIWLDTRTGVRISPDGRSIVALTADEVQAIDVQIVANGKKQCFIAEGAGKSADPSRGATAIQFLDEVPAKILCMTTREYGSGGSHGIYDK